MEARLDIICRVITRAFDAVEIEMFGVSQQHSLRLAALTAIMGRYLGYAEDHIMAIALSALFHDSALAEYHIGEFVGNYSTEVKAANMRAHCEKGQRHIDILPLNHKVEGFVLYHHERVGGTGVFQKQEGEYPLEADFISLVDDIDVAIHLQATQVDDIYRIREKANQMRESHSAISIDTFLAIFDEKTLLSLHRENINKTLDECLPHLYIDLSDPAIILLADLNANAIDYKSAFTKKHTSQIANRTYMMCDYYGYSDAEKRIMYLAAGLHDIGKAQVPRAILEKQGKLTGEEFRIIKSHVYYTYEWLSEVPGFEEVTRWAAGHHEKLDGHGYPRGLKGEELDFNTRMLGCIDIYQAVCEARPYHDARNHADTMDIMYSMVDDGKIDPQITKDLDTIMAPWSLKDVPAPEISALKTGAIISSY